jgi:3-oxoacyl-[acyl-carrier protein] reductase
METQNAIITGARSGIGLAILKLFAQNQINCWAIVHREDPTFEDTVANLQSQYGVWIKIVQINLEDSTSIAHGFKEIQSAKLPIDILVNAAGAVSPSRLFTMTAMDEIRRIMNVNFLSALELTQLTLRNMMRQRKGSIINITSIAAFCEDISQLEYTASKAALLAATVKLAREVGQWGIRVNAVAPGLTVTKMLNNFNQQTLQSAVENTPLHRMCQPEEIAEVCLFLASQKSSFITGEVIKIDGGGPYSPRL